MKSERALVEYPLTRPPSKDAYGIRLPDAALRTETLLIVTI